MPSLFFIQKISDYFKIVPSVFFLNVDTRDIHQYLLEAKGMTNQIIGYYLEYSIMESPTGLQVAVAAWRLYKRGAVVIAHGEVPYIEPSTGQRWFSQYSGSVMETHRQMVMTAVSSGDSDAATSNVLWVLRPCMHGMSDLMAIKIQTDLGHSRPSSSTTSYFRSVGSEPNLAKLVLEECGIFDRAKLNARAAAIVDVIDATRSISSTQLKLLGA